MSEVVAPDGKTMTGKPRFVRTVATPPAAPAFPLTRVAGDWVQGNGASYEVLHLRLDASGALTGSVDKPVSISTRTNLSSVVVTGKTVTRTMLSTIDATWHQIRTLAQANAQDASDANKPTNGVWSGTGSYTANYPAIGPRTGTMTVTGNAVYVTVIGIDGTFDGTSAGDGNHVSAAWTMKVPAPLTAPMPVTLTRTAAAP